MTWWKITTSGAGKASAVSASHKRWLADSTTPRAYQLSAQTRAPIPKKRELLDFPLPTEKLQTCTNLMCDRIVNFFATKDH